jgi:hypothetical protein
VALPAFRWEAVDAHGRVSQGVLEATSARAARDLLRAEGLTPTVVDVAAARADSLQHARLPAPLVTLTTRQLATLVQSGMPLDQALAAVAEQADDARAAKIVTSCPHCLRTMGTDYREFGFTAEVIHSANLVAALEHWPRQGVPAAPHSWLLTVARRQLLKQARHERLAQDPSVTAVAAIAAGRSRDASGTSAACSTRVAARWSPKRCCCGERCMKR